MEKKRCPWCVGHPLYENYHDEEWGVPTHDDRRHFEFLVLESAQAGLSWLTILKKREGYREAFAAFDPTRVARFSEREIERLITNPAIVRSRLKIEAAVHNAKQFLNIQKEFGSFSAFVWSFVEGRPLVGQHATLATVPTTTPESERLSKTLKKRGFKFVGPTTMYAHMQATGLVNDHLTSCFRHDELAAINGSTSVDIGADLPRRKSRKT